jgi:2-polyprenyl-3-methyl-5-hydroxy-6-metoxy-1,4-benzoquinol methylase
MTESQDLLSRESHFAFGENWSRYAASVGEAQINEAIAGLRRLVDSLRGKRFLDIGCGSGIHALAALRLGAAEVVAVDLDPHSVATTRRMLQTHAAAERWQVREISVFDLRPATFGCFDVVYSWGVLHHTGDLQRALRCAAALVDHDGIFAIALYRESACCGLWKLEKRWYAHSGLRAQRIAQFVYMVGFRAALMLRGRSFRTYVREYKSQRGMSFYIDVHDWLGGWPYESLSASAVDTELRSLGFERRRMFGLESKRLGIAGTGCNEYVYARAQRG